MILGGMFIALIILLAYVLFFRDKPPAYEEEEEIYNYETKPLEWESD